MSPLTGRNPGSLRVSAVAMAVYTAIVVAGGLLLPPAGERPVWTGLAIVVPAAAAFLWAIARLVRADWSTLGVEHHVLVHSTSVAFLATAAAALVYGLLEVFAGAPRLSMWAVYLFAGGAWGLGATALRWRLG